MNEKINFSFNTDERYLPYEANLTRGFWGGSAALLLFLFVVPTALFLTFRASFEGAEFLVVISLVSQLGVGALTLLFLRGGKPLKEILELGEWKKSYLVVGMTGAAFFILLTEVVQQLYFRAADLFGVNLRGKSHIEVLVMDMEWQGVAVLGLTAVMVAPLVEEILFRRVIFGYLAGKLPWVVSLVITSAAFGLIHTEIRTLPGLILLGAGFQLVYLWQKSLYPAIIMHLTNNVFAVIIMVLVKYNVIGEL